MIMMNCNIKTRWPLAAAATLGLALQVAAEAEPLKVYILAGQSNMEGHAKVETFDYIGDDPATAPLLKEMRGPDGKPRVCEQGVDLVPDRVPGQRHAGRGVRQADGRVRGSQATRPKTAARSARSSPSASPWKRRTTARS